MSLGAMFNELGNRFATRNAKPQPTAPTPAAPPAQRGLAVEPAAPEAEAAGGDPSTAAPLASDPLPGIQAGLSREPTPDELILSPGRSGRMSYVQAMKALGDGDIDGLEGLHFGRTSTGRPMVDFEDENGEVVALPVSDSVWMAALQRRTQSRAARSQLARQEAADNAVRQRIDEVLSASQTPRPVASLVATMAALNPERALQSLMRFEERRALGKPIQQEFANLQLEMADEDRRARVATYGGDLSRMRATQMRSEAALLSRDADPRTQAAAAQVTADVGTFHAFQFSPAFLKETGGQAGLAEYAMARSRGWERDGGPIQRVMALAERPDFGWTPVERPRRAEDVPAYLAEMNEWTARYLGWPAFVASPQGANAVAMVLGRNDPQLEVSVQANAALQQNAAGLQQNAALMQGLGGAQQAQAPQQQPQGGGDVPPRSRQATITGGLLRDGAVKVKDPANPTDEEISAIAMALSRRGIKDKAELERAVIEYLDMAATAGGSDGRGNGPGGQGAGTPGTPGRAP